MTRINGKTVDSFPAAFGQGYSVFTTLRLEKGQPLWIHDHLERLKNHAEALGMGWPGFEALEHEVTHYHQSGLLRLSLAPEILASSLRPLAPLSNEYTVGVSVCFTQQQIHPQLGRYKTGSYLPYRLALEEAKQAGAFEGLLLDAHGNLVDGSRTSLLVYREGRLICLQGGLEGITRQKVIQYARQLGLEVLEARLKPSQLEGQLLLAGTGVGLLSVGRPTDLTVQTLIDRFKLPATE